MTFTELVEYFETYLKPIEKEERKRLEDKYVEMQNIVKIDTPMSKTLNSIPIPATEITHESEMQSAIQSSAQLLANACGRISKLSELPSTAR